MRLLTTEMQFIVGCRNLREDNMPAGSTLPINFQFLVPYPDRYSHWVTQSGYRLYPPQSSSHIGLITCGYEFGTWTFGVQCLEGTENRTCLCSCIILRWRTCELFRPLLTLVGFSLLNTLLCFGAVVYGYPLLFKKWGRLTDLFVKIWLFIGEKRITAIFPSRICESFMYICIIQYQLWRDICQNFCHRTSKWKVCWSI